MVTTEKYPAVVSSTEDPEQRGRLKVTCAALTGDEESDLPEWVEPSPDWGWFVIPEVGEVVEIEVVTGTIEDESYGQASIDNLDARWRGVRFYGNEEGQAPTPINPEFLTNYGKRRGFATPLGHYIIFDDTAGAPKIVLTWVKNVDAGAEEISQLIIDTDGTTKMAVLGKHSIHLKANELEVKLDTGASLKVVGKDGAAVTTLGDGAVSAAIAEHLETFYGSIKSYIEGAIVPTGMGPSGNILAGSGPAPTWDGSIKSTKLKMPDG